MAKKVMPDFEDRPAKDQISINREMLLEVRAKTNEHREAIGQLQAALSRLEVSQTTYPCPDCAGTGASVDPDWSAWRKTFEGQMEAHGSYQKALKRAGQPPDKAEATPCDSCWGIGHVLTNSGSILAEVILAHARVEAEAYAKSAVAEITKGKP